MPNQTPGDPFRFRPNQPATSSHLHNDQGEAIHVLENPSMGDKYQVLEVRYGGMGEVYICKDLVRGGPRLALKTFQKRFFFDSANRGAFIREVSIWARLTGLPFIMPMLGLKYLSGRPFALMLEAEPGPSGEITLRHLLNQRNLTWDETMSITFQIAFAMNSAHQRIPGLIHGDLKPENLLLMQGKPLFISDFGLANIVHTLKQEDQLESTWAYRASEYWNVEHNTSPQGDIYAFGVILYELLAGHLPFQAMTSKEWKHVHQEQEPLLPKGFLSERRHGALMALALRCLQKQPEMRPQGFNSLLDELTQLAQLYLPGLLLLFHPDAHGLIQMPEQETKATAIDTLLLSNMPQLALTELDAMPPEFYNAELWRLRGIALSESNRDEEALHAFEQALRFDLADEQRCSYLSDYALSLKRVGRYDEAADIFHSLLNRVPEHLLVPIISNLATVYIESGQPEKAVRPLERFLRTHPELPHGWANLGKAYQMLEQYEEAVQCFRRALGLAPYMAQVQVMLAGVYMDHFRLIEEATLALDLAWAQGYTSHEWFIRFVACNILLGRDKITAQFYAQMEHDLTNIERTRLDAEIHELVEKVKRVTQSGATTQKSPIALDVEMPAVSKSQQLEKSPPSDSIEKSDSMPFGAEIELEAPSISSRDQRLKQLLSTGMFEELSGGELPHLDQELPLPFHNIRIYLAEGECSLDFYDDLTALEYVDHFIQAWQQTVRVPLVYFDPPLELRKASFYYTLCPACNICILTNRDPGKTLRCRHCGKKHQTAAVERDDLSFLLKKIAVELGEKIQVKLGKEDVVLCECVHVLCLIHLSDERQTEKIAEICQSSGFTSVPPEDPFASPIMAEALRRGLFDASRSYSIWQMTSSIPQSHLSSNETLSEKPLEVRRVLRMLQESEIDVHSLSTTYTREGADNLEKLKPDKIGEVEHLFRQGLQADPNDLELLSALVAVLRLEQKLDEAREKAWVIIGLRPKNGQSWSMLGQIEMSVGRFPEAAQALEKALEIDPTDYVAAHRLSSCYQSLEERNKAAYWLSYSRNLGNTT